MNALSENQTNCIAVVILIIVIIVVVLFVLNNSKTSFNKSITSFNNSKALPIKNKREHVHDLSCQGDDCPIGHLDDLEVIGNDHDASVLLLSCIDFRFINPTHKFMTESGYDGDYDYFILAGSSLGVNQKQYPAWSKTWWKHVELAIELHQIKKIISIGHEDCGAFRIFYPDASDSEILSLQAENLTQLGQRVKEKYPQMLYEGYYMKFGGETTRII